MHRRVPISIKISILQVPAILAYHASLAINFQLHRLSISRHQTPWLGKWIKLFVLKDQSIIKYINLIFKHLELSLKKKVFASIWFSGISNYHT